MNNSFSNEIKKEMSMLESEHEKILKKLIEVKKTYWVSRILEIFEQNKELTLEINACAKESNADNSFLFNTTFIFTGQEFNKTLHIDDEDIYNFFGGFLEKGKEDKEDNYIEYDIFDKNTFIDIANDFNENIYVEVKKSYFKKIKDVNTKIKTKI